MIKVDVLLTPLEKIFGIELKGHAESAPYGQDLVCAGVSCIITGGANSLDNDSDFDIDLKSGIAKIILKEGRELSIHDECVLETVVTQLETMEQSYGEFIEIKHLIKKKD